MIQPLQQPIDRLVDLRHRIKALVPESGYHPALYNLYADFGLGLVPGFRRPRQLAEATVTVAAWFLDAILLPEQLQCEMFVLLQLVVQRYKIGSGASLATRWSATARRK